MGQREYQTRLVGLFERAEEVGLAGVAHHKKTGEVVLVVLDGVFQHTHTIEAGSVGTTDGGLATQLLLHDFLGSACRVDGFHGL